MYSRDKVNSLVLFAIRPPNQVGHVAVAGDFNRWKPVPMDRQDNGQYVTNVRLKGGTFEYKFIVDGQWLTDPDNAHWAPNPYGTLNSLAPEHVDFARRM